MPEKQKMQLTKAEKRVIDVIRNLHYGEVRVTIRDNRPMCVEEVRKSIQLTNKK